MCNWLDRLFLSQHFVYYRSVVGEFLLVFIPNLITPNGDGSNEDWLIQNLGTDPWQLQICNQWGKVVYATTHYQNEWCAQGIPNGLYYYILTNGHRRYKGWLQVLR